MALLHNVELFIRPDGSLQFVYSDEVAEAVRPLGTASIFRASHVEPTADGAGWLADMFPISGKSTILGPFPTRAAALQAEIGWLGEYLAAH